MKKIPFLFCFLWVLLFPASAVAQYAGATRSIAEDMTSTSSYTPVQTDSSTCNYRVWTPLRNGYRITQAGSASPQKIGSVQYLGQAYAEANRLMPAQIALRPNLYAIGAVSLDDACEETTPETMSHPRRVGPDGGIGEPGALPVGDVPWWVVLLTAVGYALCRSRRVHKQKSY